MKKKKILFVILLLLIIVIPFSLTFGKIDSSAFLNSKKLFGSIPTGDGYNYHNKGYTASQLFGGTIPSFCVNSDACHSKIKSGDSMWFHEAQYGNSGPHYQGYCLHINKTAKVPHSLSLIDNFDNLTKANGQRINNYDHQIELLQALLASGWKYGENNPISSADVEDAREMLAKQILVWEIVEGGRTSFDSVVPSYNEQESAYNQIMMANNDLYEKYVQNINAAQQFLARKNDANNSPLFGKTFTMSWNANLGKYTTGEKSGLNEFGDCKSSNDNVNFSISGDKITVTTSKSNQTATITCTYVSGKGSDEWFYFKFGQEGWQDIINGSAGVTITKSFDVNAEGNNVEIIKMNDSGETVDKATFTLTSMDDSTLSYPLNGNGNPVTINKTGKYILKEKAPHGYEPIPETEITFNLSNNSVTSCTGQGTDANGNVTCQKGKITIKYNSTGNVYKIYVINTEKEFYINKEDASGKPLPGATFVITTGNNYKTPVKFDQSGNVFTYNENGKVTNIVNASASTYVLKFLPAGNYKIEETVSPGPDYVLPQKNEDRIRYIKVESGYNVRECSDSSCSKTTQTVKSAITTKNYTTKVEVEKIGAGGKKLPGVKFVLLIHNNGKTAYINSSLSAGVYKYGDEVSEISNATVYVTDNKGLITVKNLPVGTYYFKEVETVEPYILPDGEAAYTEVTINMTKDGPLVNSKTASKITISNATKEFNFYKIDENGNYLSGGKFKLQKYNDDSGKYEDVKVASVKNDGTYQEAADVFKVDEKNGKVQFTLAHGIATFIEMTPSSTYRVLELEAPKGYEVASVENSAIIKLDKNGYAKGSATIINQSKSLEGSTAQAELVIEIQTGQTVMKYGYIIAGTLIIIAGLMGALIYITKKRK